MLCRELVDYLADMPEWYLDELQQFGRVLHVDEDSSIAGSDRIGGIFILIDKHNSWI